MKLTRFCSQQEYDSYMRGDTLANTTDHLHGGTGGSISRGFCFTADDPDTAWQYLKGIVTPEVCMVLEIPDELLTPTQGRYARYINGRDTGFDCIKPEYCLAEYSNRTAKLLQVVPMEELATPLQLTIIKNIQLLWKLGISTGALKQSTR